MYTKFSTPKSCKCRECVLHPESSHGMHFIGMYVPESILPGRRVPLPAGVGYSIARNRDLLAGVFAPAK